MLIVFVAIVLEDRCAFFCRIFPLLNQLVGRNIRIRSQGVFPAWHFGMVEARRTASADARSRRGGAVCLVTSESGFPIFQFQPREVAELARVVSDQSQSMLERDGGDLQIVGCN